MTKSISAKSLEIYTIGHSTRTIETFIDILHKYEIDLVVDIRTVPKSRHNPQFNKENLPISLKVAHPKIKYKHVPGLGGLRHPRPDSINKAWRNLSFRGYADYMQTKEFAAALDGLIELAKMGPKIVLMCAEAVPWRCHRSLVADALVIRKILTTHIISATSSKKHVLTPWAKVRGKKITYPETAISAGKKKE